MSAISPTVTAVDTELDRVYRQREQLFRVAPSPARAQLIADLYDHEAWLWSEAGGFPAVRMRLGGSQGRYVVPAKAVEQLLDHAGAAGHCIEVAEWSVTWATRTSGGAA